MADNRTSLTEALRDWEHRAQQQLSAGVALVQRWGNAFPAGSMPFRLARIHGESNTLLRWRSHARSQNAARGSRFELIDSAAVFRDLPEPVQAVVLDFERRRIQINYDYAIAAYRVQRMKAVSAHHTALAELRRLHRQTREQEMPTTTR
jgi:hypothetical protein